MKTIDYSSEAISRRLRQTEQLRVLSLSLIKAKKAYDEKLRAEAVAPKQEKSEKKVGHKTD
jgi:hypothetical protein